jgi:RimJ/RimL family protein N-acetyltransferase
MTRALWVEVLTWRNDPLVYVWNRTNRVIKVDEHVAWFKNRKSKLEHEPIFAYFDGSFFVGMARLDLTSTHVYEISVLVNPSFRGIGYGKAILHDICALLSAERFAFFDVLAYIHVDNTASRTLFESFNFIRESRVGPFDVLKWITTRDPGEA